MQFLPLENQLTSFGIPEFHVSIFATSQEQAGVGDSSYPGYASFIHTKQLIRQREATVFLKKTHL